MTREHSGSAKGKARTGKDANPKTRVLGTHMLHVSLIGIKPAIWRRLAVRSDLHLGLVHAILQVAMGWTNSHLHAFSIGDRVYSAPEIDPMGDPWGPPMLDEAGITLMEAAPRAGSEFLYEYDFGDGWNHLIKAEKIGAQQGSTVVLAQCLDGARACPPEDCGGIGGYASLIKILEKPRHKEYEEMRAWLGREFDPEAFNREEIDKYLRLLKGPLVSEQQLAGILMKRDGY